MPLLPKEQIVQIGTDFMSLLNITKQRIELDDLLQRTTEKSVVIAELIKPLCDNMLIAAYSDKLQFAIAMSLAKLTEYDAKRKNGDPYFAHVLSVLNRTAVTHMPAGSKPKERIPVYVAAVLHDYFEEGDGVTPDSVGLVQKYFGEYGRVFSEEVVVLTEPNYKENMQFENGYLANIGAYIDYDQFIKQYNLSRKLLEGILMAYVYSGALIPSAVVPNDKLDNLENYPLIAKLRVQKKHPDYTKESEEYAHAVADELCEMYTITILYADKCGGRAGHQLKGEVVKQFSKIETELPVFRVKLEKVAGENLAHYFSMSLNTEHPLIVAMREYCKKLNLNLIAADL